MGNILVEGLKSPPISRHLVEVVERKGLGHPDYMCDSIMDFCSVELCREYLDRFGRIYHHNLDKGLLVAGETTTKFGGGTIEKPMKLIFGDRATMKIGGESIDINSLMVNSSKKWLDEHMRFIHAEDNVEYQVEIKQGSAELMDIFQRQGDVLGANDTSACVGYAPFSKLESKVFDLEKHLNSTAFKNQYPETGEDVKVMGLRKGDEFDITVAMPLVDRFVSSENDYFKKKDIIKESIIEFISNRLDQKFQVNYNTLDLKGRGVNGVYLTVTGTSAEGGDCGQVGRGNRINGLIPLNRPISSEAAAGKNPVSHVGKIYNALSHKIAHDIYIEIPGIKEVYVWLLSEIGTPIDRPKIAAAQVMMEKGDIKDVRGDVQELIKKEFENIQSFCMELARGKIPVA